MQIETDHREDDQTGRPLWAAPVAVVRAIIEAIAKLLGLYNRMKSIRRTTKFADNWRDHWPHLRMLEWNRARMRALAAEQWLTGQEPPPFQMDETVPDGFGGPCPRTPLEMNRRFISIAKWTLDPHADIERHITRLARRERIDLSDCPLPLAAAQRSTSPAFRAEEESNRDPSSPDAPPRRRWQAHVCATAGVGSRRILRPAAPRAPPIILRSQIANRPPPQTLCA